MSMAPEVEKSCSKEFHRREGSVWQEAVGCSFLLKASLAEVKERMAKSHRRRKEVSMRWKWPGVPKSCIQQQLMAMRRERDRVLDA